MAAHDQTVLVIGQVLEGRFTRRSCVAPGLSVAGVCEVAHPVAGAADSSVKTLVRPSTAVEPLHISCAIQHMVEGE